MWYIIETTASIEMKNEIVGKGSPGPASRAVTTVVAAIVVCTLLAPSSARSLSNGDFEVFTGGLPISWLYSQGDGPATLQSPLQSPFTDVYPLGTNSVRFTDGPAPNFHPFLRQGFPAQTGQTAFTFDFILESLSGNAWNVALAGNGGSTAFLFDIDRNGQLQIDGLTGPPTFVTDLVADQWYSVRGVADIGTHTLSGYVIPFGQSPIAFNNVPFSTLITSLDEFQIADTNVAGLNSSLYIDNVSAALVRTECFDAIESRTIRDTDDNGTPDFIQIPAFHLEVDERQIPQLDARRVVIVFGVPSSLGIVNAAIVKLHQMNWPNDDVTWYIAPDNGQVDLGDWSFGNALSTSNFSRSSTGTDNLIVTADLQTLVSNMNQFFRIGLRMTNSLIGHALFNSHLSGSPPQLCITYEHSVIFSDGFESGDTQAWSSTLP